MIITEEAYLHHSGVKGMKWGQRRAQAATITKNSAKASWKGAKAFGRGTKKAAVWSKEHPKEAAAIAIGIYSVGKVLQRKGQTKLRLIRNQPARNRGLSFVSERLTKAKSLRIPKNVTKIPDLDTPFKATLPNKRIFYGKRAEEAFRKAGAFGAPSSARKLSETTFRG